jgi:hypothetical protein
VIGGEEKLISLECLEELEGLSQVTTVGTNQADLHGRQNLAHHRIMVRLTRYSRKKSQSNARAANRAMGEDTT